MKNLYVLLSMHTTFLVHLLVAFGTMLQANGAPIPFEKTESPLPVAPIVMPKVFVPGFTVRELPIKLTSLNNIEYAADGKLFAGGYDGRFHLLQDTDGDGLEDKVETFWSQSGPNYPLGMVVKDSNPCAMLTPEELRDLMTYLLTEK